MVKDQEPEHLCKLFIGGLDYRTSDESLKSHFEQYGEIVDVIVMKDPQTKRSRGFGFVAFSQSYMVDEAQKHRPHVIDGRTVDTKRAIPRDEIGRADGGGQVKKLFVGGIKDITEDDLRDAFSQFGEVVNVSIPVERETQKKRGFAFVEFADSDSADKAALQRELMIQDNRVDVKKARDKNEMSRRGGRGGGGGGGVWGGGRDSYSQGSGGWGGSQGGWGGSQGGYGNQGYGGSQGYGGYGGSQGYGSSAGYGSQSSGQAWGGQQASGQSWGSGYGDSSGQASWGTQQTDFGNNYGQSYGGGPTRGQGSYQSNRSAPYSGGGGGSQSYGGMASTGSSGYSAGSGGGYASSGKRY